jgi:hypothetical protein
MVNIQSIFGFVGITEENMAAGAEFIDERRDSSCT